jgi:hypothetical protein
MSNQNTNANKAFSFAELGAQREAMKQAGMAPRQENFNEGGYRGRNNNNEGYRKDNRQQNGQQRRHVQSQHPVDMVNEQEIQESYDRFVNRRNGQTNPAYYNAELTHFGVGSRKAKVDKMLTYIYSMTGSHLLPTLEEFIMMIQDHKFSFNISNPNQLDKFIYACEKEYEFNAIAYRGGEEYMIALLLHSSANVQKIVDDRKKLAAMHAKQNTEGETSVQVNEQEQS